MVLLVEYKCEQTIPKHIKIKVISISKILRQVRDRESNRKHERFVSRFEHLALRPCLQHYEGFSLKTIPPDYSVPQHLQGVHTRTLGLTSPLTCSRKNNIRKHASLPRSHLYTKLSLELETMRTRKSASSKYNVEHLVI